MGPFQDADTVRLETHLILASVFPFFLSSPGKPSTRKHPKFMEEPTPYLSPGVIFQDSNHHTDKSHHPAHPPFHLGTDSADLPAVRGKGSAYLRNHLPRRLNGKQQRASGSTTQSVRNALSGLGKAWGTPPLFTLPAPNLHKADGSYQLPLPFLFRNRLSHPSTNSHQEAVLFWVRGQTPVF